MLTFTSFLTPTVPPKWFLPQQLIQKPLAKSMVGRILLHGFHPLVFTPVIMLHYMAEGTLQMQLWLLISDLKIG